LVWNSLVSEYEASDMARGTRLDPIRSLWDDAPRQ
jgi:hypothetical protein